MATRTEILRWVTGTVLDRAPDPAEAPTETDLLERLPEYPQKAQDEAREEAAAMRLIGPDAELTPAVRSPWRAIGDPAARAKADEMFREAREAGDVPSHFDPEPFLAQIARLVFASVTRFFPISPIGEQMTMAQESGVCEFPEIHRYWLDMPKADRPQHPLAPIIKAWLERPVEVAANTRTDRARTLPAQVAMFDAPEGDSRGRLFSAPWRGNSQLPLFDVGSHGAEYVTPALPLVLYELGVGHELSNRGSGAPLALRLFVEAILASPMHGRGFGKPIALNEVSVRFMLSRLYPGRRPKPNEWRPLIEAARATLASRDAAIRWDDGVPRSAVLITSFPEHLDEPVRIIVDLPPGAVHGPQVSPRLHTYGPKHGRRYRALLNLAYWWHEPGRTLFPSGRGSHWLRVEDPKRYRKLTDAELVSLVFPTSTRSEVRKLVHEAAKVLADLRDDGELRLVDDKPLPPDAEGR